MPAPNVSAFRRSRRAASVGRLETFYPSPFFDIATQYIPNTVKETFDWCLYYQLTNPIISAVTSKLATYPITELVYETENPGEKSVLQSLFEKDFNLRVFLVETNLDRYTFGNSFTSVSFPIKKMLKCRNCGTEKAAKDSNYTWSGFKRRITCTACDHTGPAIVRDDPVRAPKRINLIRWNPKHITIKVNEITGDKQYYYKIPRMLRNQIILGKPDVIETIPEPFIEAVAKKKAIRIDKDKIYHSKRPSASRSPSDAAWGAPLILPVLKDIFFLQILRKSQEAVAMEHIVPMRTMFPQVTADGNNPYTNINLKDWQKEVMAQIGRWRQDCVSPETLVETQSGLRLAKDISEGDLLKNHLGEWSKVEKLWERPLRDGEQAFKIHARGLSAVESIVSEGHPFYAAKSINRGNGHKLGLPEFIMAKDLRPGDYVGYPIKRNIVERPHFDLADYSSRVATDEYVYVDYTDSNVPHIYEWLTSNPDRTLGYGERNQFLEERGWGLNEYKVAQTLIRRETPPRRVQRFVGLSPETAWVLGLYTAEGSCNARQVHFALHTDEEQERQRLAAFFRETFGVDYHLVEHGNGTSIVFSSLIAAEFFSSVCPGISRTKEVPTFVKESTVDVVRGYLNGLITGDGCYHQDGRSNKTTYRTSSTQLAEDVRALLLSLEIATSIRRVPPQEYSINGRQGVSGDGYLLQISGCSNTRLRAFLRGEEQEAGRIHMGVFRDGYFWHRIDSIESVECDTVIGFQMDKSAACVSVSGDTETHGTFCIWGMASANSNHIPVMPVPIGTQTIGGQGKAYLLHQEIRIYSEQIIAGMGVPTSFFYGESQYCLSGDTLVPTSDGMLTLEDLSPEDPNESEDLGLVTQSHEGRSTILRSHNTGEKEEWQVDTSFGFRLKGSGDHKALVLMPDMSTQFIRFEDLKEGDHVLFKEGAELWPESSPHDMSLEEARVLGYLTAEGTTTDMFTKRRNRVSFDNCDKGPIEDFVKCCEVAFGKKLNVSWREFPGANKPCGHVDLSSVDAMRRLGDLGLKPVKAAEKEVPQAIMRAPRAHVVEFIKTYFDGDGGLCRTDPRRNIYKVAASSKSELLIRQLQALLLNLGIVSTVTYSKSQKIWKVGITGRNIQRYAEEIGFVSQRKIDSLKEPSPARNNQNHELKVPYLREAVKALREAHFEFKRGCITRDGRKIKLHVPQYGVTYPTLTKKVNLGAVRELDPNLADRIEWLAEREFRFAKVRSVSKTGKVVPMYDLTVEEAHSYTANGLLTHNSGASVNLRALENEFMGNREDMTKLVEFIRDQVCSFLRIPKVPISFKPFKMADDLQRASFQAQMVGMKQLSKKTFLESQDYEYDTEMEMIAAETKEEAKNMRTQIVQQAEANGEAMLINTRYQVKAQEIQQESGMMQQPMPGDPNQQDPAQQGQPQQQQQQQQGGQQPPQAIGGQSPMTMDVAQQGGMNVDMGTQIQKMSEHIQGLPTVDRYKALTQLRNSNPQLYQLVNNSLGASTPGGGLRPLPTATVSG